MNINVAIRVRPFNNREKALNSKLCIKMTDSMIKVYNEKGQLQKKFQFDHCFWSHDGFKADVMGYNRPEDHNSKYADQKLVYEKLGQELLENFVKGFNCCIFAYGQTGAGKSYSIFGYGINKGIVPIMCEDLLSGKKWEQMHEKNVKTVLKISMLEIYKERIQDLLIPVDQRTNSGLKIRETDKLGTYVEDLKKVEVRSFIEIEQIIEKGNENKTLGSTLMNATSSRAHTIISLTLVQKQIVQDQEVTKESTIHLVDLAGSEKVKKTAAKKDRLKEACSINKSLSELGNVISQLYKNATKKKKVIVSYRNSVLTRILQNSLGGNSKTTMICAVSPALNNIEETLSTLRYANQAKAIKCKAVINESATDKLIRQLTEENQKLKEMLNQIKDSGDTSQIHMVQKQLEGIDDKIKENKNDSLLIEDRENRKSKIEEIGSHCMSFENIPKDAPLLINLNEDPLIAEKMCYSFKYYPQIEIGRQSKSKQNLRIVINSVGIVENHAKFVCQGNTLFLESEEPDGAFNCFVNGQCLEDFEEEIDDEFLFRKQLKDQDRIVFGTCTTFLVRIPSGKQMVRKVIKNGSVVDWEFCQLEKFEIQESKERLRQLKMLEEKKKMIQAKEQELIKKFEEERKEYERIIQAKEQEYQEMMKKMQMMMNQQDKQESEEKIETIKQEQNTRRSSFMQEISKLKKENTFIDKVKAIDSTKRQELIQQYHKLKEANTIADELNRRITFVPFLGEKIDKNDLVQKIKVINKEEGWYNLWSLEKFDDRLELMKEQVQEFQETGCYVRKKETDPFYDEKELFHFGKISFKVQEIIEKEIEGEYVLQGIEEEIGKIYVNISCEKYEDNLKMKIEIQNLELYDLQGVENKLAYFEIKSKLFSKITDKFTNNFKLVNSSIPLEMNVTMEVQNLSQNIQKLEKDILQIELFAEEEQNIPKMGFLPPPTLEVENKNNMNESIHQKNREMLQNPQLIDKKQSIRTSIFDQANFSQQRLSKNMCQIF